MSLADATETNDFAQPSGERDGKLLAPVSLGLAIGGIVVPIVLSIAAIVAAGIAKRRLGRRPGTREGRSLANAAQCIAVLDMSAIGAWLAYYLSTLR